MRRLVVALAAMAAHVALAQEATPPPAAQPAPAATAAPQAAESPPPAPEAKVTKEVEPETPHAWEVDLFLGYGQNWYPDTDTANVTWSNGGPGVSIDVAYRGPHFTHPFFELAYVPALSSGKNVNVFEPGAGPVTVYSKSYAHALGFLIGAGWDVDWFRGRAGIGFYDYEIQTFTSTESDITQLTVGFLLSAAAFVWRPEPFALGVEARLVALQQPLYGIYQTMWELGITGRWDFVNVKGSER